MPALHYDTDVQLLLAIALSAKRRPADLSDIFAAFDLITESPPSAAKLLGAFTRLSTHGLILTRAEGTALTPEGEGAAASPSPKSSVDERLFSVREQLSSRQSEPLGPPSSITEDDLIAAQTAHVQKKASTTRSLLMPKPAPAAAKPTGPGLRQRRPRPAKRRKF